MTSWPWCHAVAALPKHTRGFNESNNSMTSRLSEWPCGERNGITAARRLREPKRNLKHRRSAPPSSTTPPLFVLTRGDVFELPSCAKSHSADVFPAIICVRSSRQTNCYCDRSHLVAALMLWRRREQQFLSIYWQHQQKRNKMKRNHGLVLARNVLKLLFNSEVMLQDYRIKMSEL